jgi:hypothetical protein
MTVIVSPAVTLYCLPPVLMTANNLTSSYSERLVFSRRLTHRGDAYSVHRPRARNATDRRVSTAGHRQPRSRLEVSEPSEPARRRHIRRRNAPRLSIAAPAGCLQSLAPIVNHLMAPPSPMQNMGFSALFLRKTVFERTDFHWKRPVRTLPHHRLGATSVGYAAFEPFSKG